jgi:GDPmannose 4,6-dehydratase
MKKALIFGVSGQDGAYLAKLMLSKGYTVYGTSRDAQVSTFRNLKYLGIREQVQLESAALNDFRSVLQVLKKTQPDEVYNLAGQTSVGLSFEQPVETLESIAVGSRLSFIMRLSSEVFGDINGAAADESTPFSPRSPYAVAKATAVWEVANYRETYCLFACSGILFDRDSPLRPERFVTQKIVASAGQQDKLYLGNIDIQRD